MNEKLTEGSAALSKKVTRAWSLQPILVPFYALILAVLVGGVLIAIVGVNPFTAYGYLLKGMFGSGDRIAGSVARSVPFMGSALALAIAFKAGLFNIGAEGQLLIGGVTAAWVGTWAWMADMPALIAIPIVILAGMFGGGIWGAIPGLLRAKTGAHEVITTIMLNSIGLFGVRWLVSSQRPVVLRDIESTATRTRPIAEGARLPSIIDSSQPNLHLGLILLIVASIAMAFLLDRTSFGFEVNTVGLNPGAASYAGISVNRTIIAVMALSGAMAGLAAASEVSGTNGSFQPGTFAGMGFDGIAIALLARAKPIPIIFSSILWGSMLSGAPLMQQEADVSIDVVRIIQALVLLLVAADAIVRYIFRVKGETGNEFAASATMETA